MGESVSSTDGERLCGLRKSDELEEWMGQQHPIGAVPSKGTLQWAAPWFSLHKSHSRTVWVGQCPWLGTWGFPCEAVT